MRPADPTPFSVFVKPAEAVRISRLIGGRVNADEFRGWRPQSITLLIDADQVADVDGNVRLTLTPQPMVGRWRFIDPSSPSGVGDVHCHDAIDFAFIEALPDYVPVA